MDILAISTALASLVELYGQYRAEGVARDEDTIENYLEWLRRKDQRELVDLVNNNVDLSISLHAVVNGNHTELLAKLGEIGQELRGISSQVAALAVGELPAEPAEQLTDQALSILRQLKESNARYIHEAKGVSFGVIFYLIGGSKEILALTDPKFVDDDFDALCNRELLREEFDDKGHRKFTLTRDGSRLVGD